MQEITSKKENLLIDLIHNVLGGDSIDKKEITLSITENLFSHMTVQCFKKGISLSEYIEELIRADAEENSTIKNAVHESAKRLSAELQNFDRPPMKEWKK